MNTANTTHRVHIVVGIATQALRADFPASDDTSVGKLAMQLQELEERREVAITQAQKRTLWWMWGLAGAMVTQFGVFFYLTFVLEEEYGW